MHRRSLATLPSRRVKLISAAVRVGQVMAADHPRNTRPMLTSRRCGAKTRSGRPCVAPAVSGRLRCRMHGGAAGSGAPRGNKNAFKHGRYTAEAIAQRRQLRELLQQSRALIRRVGAAPRTG
jgi:hypothetical protein